MTDSHVMKNIELNVNLSRLPKIPQLHSVEGWESINIAECREALVPLTKLKHNRILVKAQYFLMGSKGALEECFVRESVAKKLIHVAEKLPQEYLLVIWDAWRPIELQQLLFETYREKNKINNPGLQEDVIIKLTRKYVSLPSINAENPSPHNTGGAIDITICDATGTYLNMGTSFDDFSEKADTRHYELKTESNEVLSEEEIIILNNRRLLFHAMRQEGFTNYFAEWWHYDYGNQFWGKIKGQNAIYGRIYPQG